MNKKKTTPLPTEDQNLGVISDTLTRQERFCLEYAVCLNGTKAAKLAGYEGDNRTLAVTASRLLRSAKIRARLNELLAEYAMEKREVLGRLTAQARADMADLLDPSTMSVDWKRAQELGVTHLIKKVKQTTITQDEKETLIFELELHDSQAALVHLGKAYAMFTDKLKVEDWRTDAIEAIRRGEMTYQEVVATFQDEGLAAQLFQEAGVKIARS